MDNNQVKQDVTEWINDFVTKPNKLLNNLPPCPYARRAILEKKVDIRVPEEGTVSYAIADTLQTWSDELDVVMLIFDPTYYTADMFSTVVEQANETIDKNFVLLDDHPDNEEVINGVKMNMGKYAIVFVQKTDKLLEGHEYLKKHTDYYGVWSQENLDDVVTWRKDRKRS